MDILNYELFLVQLTEDFPPFMGQAVAVDGQIVNRNPGQCENKAPPCVPGVRVQRQAHDEEANHREGDGDDHGHLWVVRKKRAKSNKSLVTFSAC